MKIRPWNALGSGVAELDLHGCVVGEFAMSRLSNRVQLLIRRINSRRRSCSIASLISVMIGALATVSHASLIGDTITIREVVNETSQSLVVFSTLVGPGVEAKTAERTKDVLEIDVQSEAIVFENVAYASFQGVASFVIELGDLDWVGSPRTITDVKLSTVGSSLRRDDIFFTGNSVTVPITPAFWDYGAVATIGLVFDQDNKVVPEPTSAIVWAVLGIAAMSVMIRCRLF